jgi:hypothetical protein
VQRGAVIIPFPMARRFRRGVTMFLPLSEVAVLERAEARLVLGCALTGALLTLAMNFALG